MTASAKSRILKIEAFNHDARLFNNLPPQGGQGPVERILDR
jgi:hypothetical protein